MAKNQRPTGASSSRKPTPKQSPGKSLTRAILRFLGLALRAVVVSAIRLWIWVVDGTIWCLLWIGRNPWRITKTSVSILFRIATLLSVGYLVFDRIYETEATISSPVLDSGKPFVFPFTITNNSHIFTIRNVQWNCTADRFINVQGGGLTNVSVVGGTTLEILPGQGINVNCNVHGASAFFKFNYDFKIADAVMEIRVAYDVDILGLYTSHRSLLPTRFTWFKDAARPQWVRGDFAK
jgi:hypothetical protein